MPDGRQFIVVAGNINYETVQVTLSYESNLKNLSKYDRKNKSQLKLKFNVFTDFRHSWQTFSIQLAMMSTSKFYF